MPPAYDLCLGSDGGPIIGAISIELLSELLREYGEIRMVLFAFLVIVIMRVNREGIVGIGKVILPKIKSVLPSRQL